MRTCTKLRSSACHQRQPREHHEAALPEHAACLWHAYFCRQHAMPRWGMILVFPNTRLLLAPPRGSSLCCRRIYTTPLTLRKTVLRGCNAAACVARDL